MVNRQEMQLSKSLHFGGPQIWEVKREKVQYVETEFYVSSAKMGKNVPVTGKKIVIHKHLKAAIAASNFAAFHLVNV